MSKQQTIEIGLTHPQIHLDYYEWLNKIKKDVGIQTFISLYGFSAMDFHAIAMFVWTASREELAKKVKVYE
jgi:hypothetical protein